MTINNLREAIATANKLGVTCQEVRGTGEIRFIMTGQRPVVVNRRRKDTPKKLITLLRRAGANRE